MKRLFIALFMGFFCVSLHGAQPFANNLRYDEVCYLTSHNSYAAHEHGYLYGQQAISIEKQLALGVRGLMLDTFQGKEDILLCHGSQFITRCICRGKEPMPLYDSLVTIRKFLENNPTEVITIFLENYVTDGEKLDEPFVKAQLTKYILTPSDWDPKVEKGWPTFGWLRNRNKRLIIFNSTEKTSLCYDEWKHVAENQWGTLHPVRACRERPESKAWKHEDRSIYLLNYFPMFNLSFDNSYQRINTKGLDSFLKRALTYGLDTGSNKSPFPTFLCIDFVQIGNGMDHVKAINKQKQHRRLILAKSKKPHETHAP